MYNKHLSFNPPSIIKLINIKVHMKLISVVVSLILIFAFVFNDFSTHLFCI